MARKPYEAGVSFEVEHRHALEAATRCLSTSQSQYIRQATLLRLINEGFLPHPLAATATANDVGVK